MVNIDPGALARSFGPYLLSAVGTSALHMELLPVADGGAAAPITLLDWPDTYPMIAGTRRYLIVSSGVTSTTSFMLSLIHI